MTGKLILWDFADEVVVEEFSTIPELLLWLENRISVSRSDMGYDSAAEFADDNNMATAEYIDTYGMPFEDDEEWANWMMNELGYAAGTLTGNRVLIHNVFAAERQLG